MNVAKLKEAEKEFLTKYPGGFANPHFADMEKKYKMAKHSEFAQEAFAKSEFKKPELVVENFSKLVSRSSLVSVFEKPKLKDFTKVLTPAQKKQLASGLELMLHHAGSDVKQEKGFNQVLDILSEGKLAKWSLISCVPVYYHPKVEVFVKPTTAKGVVEVFGLKNMVYKPRPSWEFYTQFRESITKMKKKVSKSLSPSNPAFTGFLMMALDK
ncbi:MAG: hypothetical protein AAF518_19805 [Spirochaetota bacterium]